MENGTQPQPPSQPSSSLPGQSQPQPHIHHISQTQQTQQAHQQAQDHGHVEAQSSHQLQPRPRKFTIQSNFGNARQRRSRKNRPCDACRKRKTGCVITTGPPCKLFLSLVYIIATMRLAFLFFGDLFGACSSQSNVEAPAWHSRQLARI